MPTENFKVGEMLNKRTKNTKTWINFDGSYTTEIHSGIVHFDDGLNNLHNINTDLLDEADADLYEGSVSKHGKEMLKHEKEKVKAEKKLNKLDRDKFDFQVPTLPFSCQIPKNIKKGYSIGQNDEFIRFIPQGASPSKGYVNKEEKNKIQYQDAWNDADVILEVITTGVKETIILKTDRAPLKFSFEVEGTIEDDLTSGNMKLEPAWLQDANGEKRDVEQTIRREGEQTFIDLVADVTGLVYPIEIDPTVTIQSPSTTFKDTYTNASAPTTSDGSNTYMEIGNVDGRRGYIQFGLANIPVNAVVSLVNLNLYANSGYTPGNGWSFGVSARRVMSDWAENITHNTRPNIDSRFEGNLFVTITNENFTKQYYPLNITNIAKDWLNGTFPNYGLGLVHDSTGYFIDFLTSNSTTNKPYVSVTYNIPPTAPTLTSPNGGETWNSSHTVTWEPSFDSDNTATNYFASGSGINVVVNQTTDIWIQPIIPVVGGYKTIGIGVDRAITADVQFVELDSEGNVLRVIESFNGVNTISRTGFNGVSDTRHWFDLNLNIMKDYSNIRTGILIKNHSVAYFPLTPTASSGVYRAYKNGILVGYITNAYLITASSNIQYQIQLTTDGTNWSDIIALTTAGATQYIYDFINKPQTSLAKIRIRAYDGSAYGPWDESNGVFSIIHNLAPSVPTNLTPVTTKDRAQIIRFAWQHNDPNSDPQSKFDLDYRLQGSTTWNTVTQNTINQFYDLLANTLPKGTIEWRVRTYDQADLSGPYSEIKTFLAGDKPSTPTTLNPIDGSIVSLSNPTVEWSSVGQVGYNLKVLDATETTMLWETTQTSNNKAHTVGYSLENETDYVIQLTISNVDGLSSNNENTPIHVSYTPPAKAIVSTIKGEGIITLSIDNPVPVGTEPNVSYNSIFRRKQGETEFIRIETNIPTDGSFIDYTLASEQVYEYFVRTWGVNDTYNDSVIISASITLKGVWLHDVTNPSTIHNFKFDGGGRSRDLEVEANYMQFAGRESPVTEFGEHEHNSIRVTLNMLKKSVDLNVLDSLIRAKNTLCYRDGRGRRIFGTATSLPTDDEFYGYEVDFKITQCSYSEEV